MCRGPLCFAVCMVSVAHAHNEPFVLLAFPCVLLCVHPSLLMDHWLLDLTFHQFSVPAKVNTEDTTYIFTNPLSSLVVVGF
jgi:hypothetical protein